MGNRGPVHVDDILASVVARLGFDRNLDDYRIWEAWNEVVGPSVARNAQPQRLDSRRLVVTVKNNAWMQELSLLRKDLCARLNSWMEREVVAEIFLVVGRVEPPSETAREPRRGDGPASSHPSSRRGGTDHAPPADPDQVRVDLTAAIERLWARARGTKTAAEPDQHEND